MQNTSKRKAIAVGMIPVAVITIGMITAAAFADKNESATSTEAVAESTAVVAESTAVVADGNVIPDTSDFSEEGGLIVEYNDGATRYSVDGGETWSETVPDGVELETRFSEDGLYATIFNGSLLAEANYGEVQRSAVKMDESDKAVMFSEDDGLTWSELSPDNYVYEVNEEEGYVLFRYVLTIDE